VIKHGKFPLITCWAARLEALVTIRRLEPEEVDLHRDVRLRSLRESPDSFGETATEAEEQPQSYWEELTRSVTEADGHVMFLAYEGGTVAGSVYGLLDRENANAGRIGGMWVDPSFRRQGIGRALLQAVVSWGRQRQFVRFGLWAPAHSAGAIAFYRRAGFMKTDRQRPLRKRENVQIIEMEYGP
jgi:ribosomal protein S18 acetylase RimI-like enzyme